MAQTLLLYWLITGGSQLESSLLRSGSFSSHISSSLKVSLLLSLPGTLTSLRKACPALSRGKPPRGDPRGSGQWESPAPPERVRCRPGPAAGEPVQLHEPCRATDRPSRQPLCARQGPEGAPVSDRRAAAPGRTAPPGQSIGSWIHGVHSL